MTNQAPNALPRRQFVKQLGLTAASAAILSGTFSAYAEEESESVTIALVGCAHIHTPSFASLLRKRDDVTVKYVWDHDKARAEKYAKMLQAKAVEDPKTIWDDPAVKAVVICSETNRHHDLILPAAAAKKHMFAEKPLGVTAAESREMADAIEKNNLLFTTGYFMRTSSQILFLKEQVEKGVFGKITHVRGSNCHEGSLAGWFDGEFRWMADPKQSGVGGFGDLGTHSLDIMMWLFGDVDSIVADVKVVTGHYGDCDESGEALIKFKNGITGTLAAGWVDVDNPVSLVISGTEAHATIINGELFFKGAKIEGADGKQPWTKLPAALPVPMVQFVEALNGKPSKTLVTVREAAARVSVMEAAYKSAHDRVWAKPA